MDIEGFAEKVRAGFHGNEELVCGELLEDLKELVAQADTQKDNQALTADIDPPR